MNLPPLPEPFYITRSNGRLYEVESGADVTGRVIDAYTQDQLRQAQREAVAAAVPEGWKLVPIEPTQEMCVVDFDCDDSVGIDSARIIYKAMLAASPEVNPSTSKNSHPSLHRATRTEARHLSPFGHSRIARLLTLRKPFGKRCLKRRRRSAITCPLHRLAAALRSRFGMLQPLPLGMQSGQ